MLIPATLTQPGFLDLLCDALFQFRLSREASAAYTQNRHARSCIIALVFSVESCANCLVEHLNLSSGKKKKIMQAPVLEKLKFCVHAMANATLDFERTEVRKMKELIKARNDFVHPKVTSIETEMGAMDDLGDVLSWSIVLQPKVRESTELPVNALFWNPGHAADALSAVLGFLSHLFNELLKPSLETGPNFLLPSISTKIGVKSVTIECPFQDFENELKMASEIGFDFDFLGFHKAESCTNCTHS